MLEAGSGGANLLRSGQKRIQFRLIMTDESPQFSATVPVDEAKAAEPSTQTRGVSMPVSARFPRSVLAVLVLAFLAKCAMALFTYGNLDVTIYRGHAAAAKNAAKNGGLGELYREPARYLAPGIPYPYQVPMIHVVLFWDLLENVTGLPLQFWMRFTSALADVGTVLLVWRLSLRRAGFVVDKKTLILLAACPISLMISGFHGQIDPIMVFFLVASVYFVEARKASMAGLFFGLAMCIKVVPILFALCFLLAIGGLRPRVRFAAISAATFGLAGMPYFAQYWRDILHAVATYNSQPWVASKLFASFGVGPTTHKIVFFALSIGLSVFMNIPLRRVPLFIQVGAVTALFLALAPGFGEQYFAWAVPWVVSLGAWNAAIYYLVPGAFLARLYTIWSGGLPWYAADDTSSKLGTYDGILLLLSWLAVCWTLSMFILSVARIRRGRMPT
jgi:Glycosyltransferase family 87